MSVQRLQLIVGFCGYAYLGQYLFSVAISLPEQHKNKNFYSIVKCFWPLTYLIEFITALFSTALSLTWVLELRRQVNKHCEFVRFPTSVCKANIFKILLRWNQSSPSSYLILKHDGLFCRSWVRHVRQPSKCASPGGCDIGQTC